MSKLTTTLFLLQLVLIIIGYFVLGTVLKMCGYPDPMAMGVRWNSLPVFLREHGFWLLIPSLLWVAYAIAAERLDRGFLSFRVACGVGVCLAIFFLSAFMYSAVFPYTRSITVYVPSKTESSGAAE